MRELFERDGYWKKSRKRTGRYILSVIGKECQQIYKKKKKKLPMSAEERADTEKNLERLTNYFEPKQNIIYQRYMFNSCIEGQCDKFDAYLIKLRHLIKTCEYGALEDEILHDRIVNRYQQQ